MSLVANARMYAVNPTVAAHWNAFFDWVARASGVPLSVIAHAAPAPLEELWRRRDLGLAFICGFPFAGGGFAVEPVAAPVPASGDGRPLYATHLAVRADSGLASLRDSFGGRIGWTVEHSQSGFNAVRTHLLAHWQGAPLFAGNVGPLLTPRRVIDALLAGDIDIGPLDSYFHDLLRAHEPEAAARLAIVETTEPRPMPLLVSSRDADPALAARLRETLLAAAGDAEARPLLARLRLAGFAAVEPFAYQILIREARAADAAGYSVPG